ncbi:hypothetical protein [Parasediminibacterium sp. JCM 36343]|uniref:hypothetical protein n=1 Tax=Parasediminibacterium sp. JCM 36343 TaxID=3374279 RepID=UPI0039790F7D
MSQNIAINRQSKAPKRAMHKADGGQRGKAKCTNQRKGAEKHGCRGKDGGKEADGPGADPKPDGEQRERGTTNC